jgi:predicted kinase
MRKMVFTMGLPGSGKSSTANKMFSGYKFIDPDLFKVEHPEYDPKNPGLVHEWSADQAEAAFEKALVTGGTFIVDGTGVNAERMVRRIEAAQSAGFFVELLYVTVSLKTALARNESRERTVDPSIVISKARDIGTSFKLVGPHADKVTVIDNNDDNR